MLIREATPEDWPEIYESLGFEIVGTVPEAFRHPVDGYVGLHVMYRAL